MLENRVNIIEGLQKNQVSPVVALDQLAQAVHKTQYVWLSTLDQNNAVFNMSGMGTSLNAIADFYYESQGRRDTSRTSMWASPGKLGQFHVLVEV